MKIKEIIQNASQPPVTINEAETVGEAMELLEKHKIGSLIVCDSSEKATGIITERDIFRLMCKFKCDITSKKISEHMSRRLVIGLPDDDINYIGQIMTQNHIRHIPIMDEEKNLCGIVSIGDILKAELEEAAVHARYLNEYITGVPENAK